MKKQAKNLKPKDIILHGGKEVRVEASPVTDPENQGKLSIKTDSWGMFSNVPPEYTFNIKLPKKPNNQN